MSRTFHRLFEYLEGQQGVFFEKLYEQPSTALAVFRRMLPHLGAEVSYNNLGYCD